jgi:PPOX class probable F420-dependent enzyme
MFGKSVSGLNDPHDHSTPRHAAYHRAMRINDVIHTPPDPSPPVPATLSTEARAFLSETRFAVVATVDPDGAPHSAVVWYRLERDELVLNSAEGRRWPANLRRDPRVEVTVADGYRYVQLGGSMSVIDDQAVAQADIAEMARRYHADEPAKAEALIRDRFTRQQRVSFRLRPSRIGVDL